MHDDIRGPEIVSEDTPPDAPDRIYGPYHKAVASLGCILRAQHSCMGDVIGHHVRAVGMGGKGGGEDFANEVPVCYLAHQTIHQWGRRTFEDRYGIDLAATARLVSTQAFWCPGCRRVAFPALAVLDREWRDRLVGGTCRRCGSEMEPYTDPRDWSSAA